MLFRLLARLQPADFRARHGLELLEFYREAWAEEAAGRSLFARAVVLVRFTTDALASSMRRRLSRWRARRTVGSWRGRSPGRRENSLDGWRQDVVWAVRSVVRRPGFALVVIATLGLGVGANTAVFGVLNAVLLTPLPYDEPERLVRLYLADEVEAGDAREYLGAPSAVHFRDNARMLDVAVFYDYRASSADLTGGDRPERVRMLPVSSDYFRVLRAPLLLGRGFNRDEERRDATVVVVTERLFRRYFDGDRRALGRTLRVDGVAHTVVGVLPADFEDPVDGGIDLYRPVHLPPAGYEAWEWQNHHLSALARLRPGTTLAAARREARDLARMQSELAGRSAPWSAELLPLREDALGRADTMLVVLMAAVSLLLLIACVNIASLFLARGAARAPELAVRSALGSPRRRLVRQLAAEALLLAMAGGAVGLALSFWVGEALLHIAPAELRLESVTTDARVFAFGLAAALAVGLISGVAPALRFTRPGLEQVLREGGRGGMAGRAEGRARNVLVVAELSLALVLLVGAGVLIRSFDRLRRVDLNLDPRGVITFQVNLPDSRYGDPELRARFHRALHERLRALPDVRAVGAVSRLPVTGTYHSWGAVRLIGDSTPDPASPRGSGANNRVVEGDFFSAVRIPVLQGRVFGPEDRAGSVHAAVVNRTFARLFFPGEEPLGRRIGSGGRIPLEIIGVVADVPITARGMVVPMIYRSHAQYAADRNWALTQVVSLAGARQDFLDDVRREVAALDPELVLYEPRLLEDVLGQGTAHERFSMLLVVSFAALAVLLAAVGIYGVLAYSVSRRRPEIGIRMALGARPRDVQRMVIGQGARLAAFGILLGLAGALALTRALASLVFEVSVRDPAVFAAGAVAILVISVVASGLPAAAATRVDPLETMRRE